MRAPFDLHVLETFQAIRLLLIFAGFILIKLLLLRDFGLFRLNGEVFRVKLNIKEVRELDPDQL
jgi:hypothetical protein